VWERERRIEREKGRKRASMHLQWVESETEKMGGGRGRRGRKKRISIWSEEK